jgi:lipopolysaccharide export LptBFGC system permease protein LptF
MTKCLIFMISALIIVLLLALSPQNISTESKAFAQLPVQNAKSNASRLANPSSAITTNNGIITIHTTNSIQGNNFNVIKQQEPGIRKAILSNIDNAIFIAKGSVKTAIPVNVNAKIINQLANSRVDTTQGIDMTKRLTATELMNAINATTPSFISHFVYKPARVIVDNEAICSGIASPTKAACAFTIDIHN